MLFMNEYDIEDEVQRWAGDPVMGPATQTLSNLRDVVNQNSDGWAYWPKPVRAAAPLMTVIQSMRPHLRNRVKPPTAAEVKKAYTPIKSFLTRNNLTMEVVQPA